MSVAYAIKTALKQAVEEHSCVYVVKYRDIYDSDYQEFIIGVGSTYDRAVDIIKEEIKNVACCIGAKIEYGNCCHIDVHGPEDVTYKFETDIASLLNWEELQEELMHVCPHLYVQSAISNEFFGVARRTISITLQPIDKYRF